MTAPWFTVSSVPTQRSYPNSAAVRAEFAAVETAFNKLPSNSGAAGRLWAWNSGETAVQALSTLGVDLADGSLAIGIAIASTNIGGWGRAVTLNGPESGNAAVELSMNGTLAGYISYSNSGATLIGFNLYAYANIPLIFGANNTERMRIAADGRIALGAGGIATAVDVAVRGTTANSAQQALGVYNSGGDGLLVVRNDGLFNTGTRANAPYNLTTGSAANLHVTSDGNFARSTSSIKYKQDVANYIGALPKIRQLRPVRFRSKPAGEGRPDVDGARWFAGLIAEEVHAAGLEEFVEYDADGQPDAVMYSHLVALSLRGIQELDARVNTLEAAKGGRP